MFGAGYSVNFDTSRFEILFECEGCELGGVGDGDLLCIGFRRSSDCSIDAKQLRSRIAIELRDVHGNKVNGQTMEPIEYLVIEVPPTSVGAVMELVGNRRAECLKLDARGEMTHIEFTIPARGLIGLRTRLMNATYGEAIIHHNFYDYQATRGSIPSA